MTSKPSQKDLGMNTRCLWWIWGWIHLKTCGWWVTAPNILKRHRLDPTANPSVCDGSGAGSITNWTLTFFHFLWFPPRFWPLNVHAAPNFFGFLDFKVQIQLADRFDRNAKTMRALIKKEKKMISNWCQISPWQLGFSLLLREISEQS